MVGITVWIATIAFSSNTLISYENGKQAKVVKSIVDTTTKQITGIKNSTLPTTQTSIETKQVNQEIQVTKKVVSQPVVTTPKTTTTTSKAPDVQKPVQHHDEEEESDDN